MYKGSQSVVSTLCYGVQWDAVMNLVSDVNYNITDSKSWGNYWDSTGDASTNSGSLQVCGKNEVWKAKNIYDLAGNVTEWTMEYFLTNKQRLTRGGTYDNFGNNDTVSSRGGGYSWNLAFDSVGFRVTLYLK